MNDAQKQLLDSTQKGVFQFTQLVAGYKKINTAKDSIITVQSSDIDRFLEINNTNVKAMVKKDKTIEILKYVTITQAIIFALFVAFK
jgi:hypothetical protein